MRTSTATGHARSSGVLLRGGVLYDQHLRGVNSSVGEGDCCSWIPLDSSINHWLQGRPDVGRPPSTDSPAIHSPEEAPSQQEQIPRRDMLFQSFEFLGFFLVVFSLYWGIPSFGFRRVLLLVASCFFYMSWKPWTILL